MRALVEPVETAHTPESLVESLGRGRGTVLLRSGSFASAGARFSCVAADPFGTFEARGAAGEYCLGPERRAWFGNPWRVLERLAARFELPDEADVPFPLGGIFGFWGYDLRHAVEPRLTRRAADDLELPDCRVGFFDALVVFDHHTGRVSVISTGLGPDGSRDAGHARRRLAGWRELLETPPGPEAQVEADSGEVTSTTDRRAFTAAVRAALDYIHRGHIYQVNLARRLSAGWAGGGWELFRRLSEVSPAPFSAYLDAGDFELASSSPEMFLRLSGAHALTRPIKGTRPRGADATLDAQLAWELQTSPKELAELVMITDLLRNDLGRVCEYGSVQVPELVRLERFAQVQHLVATIEGRLRPDVTHLAALAAAFPGGSITGAPKIRAMDIIDELEPVARGPYTGCAGYLGFNRESQFSILIRTAVVRGVRAWYHAGAGIVADSDPEAEFEETEAKARGFLAALRAPVTRTAPSPARSAAR